MSILIVGGDRLGNIVRNLHQIGFRDIRHISGRKKAHSPRPLSQVSFLAVKQLLTTGS
ncbi:hypothetical protein ACP3TJ_01695 [Desulforudis sp. 1088]|uniref:hypothetical protein n=1 Tax=unclassified Candidatus Desulforudis TaxID=2635950 RepID=UPI0034870296